MTYQHILYDVRERVATITFNRPEARNFLDEPLLDEWVDALRRAERDPETRVVVIKGAGSASAPATTWTSHASTRA